MKLLPLWVFALPTPLYRLVLSIQAWWLGEYDPMREDRERSNDLSYPYWNDPR